MVVCLLWSLHAGGSFVKLKILELLRVHFLWLIVIAAALQYAAVARGILPSKCAGSWFPGWTVRWSFSQFGPGCGSCGLLRSLFSRRLFVTCFMMAYWLPCFFLCETNGHCNRSWGYKNCSGRGSSWENGQGTNPRCKELLGYNGWIKHKHQSVATEVFQQSELSTFCDSRSWISNQKYLNHLFWGLHHFFSWHRAVREQSSGRVEPLLPERVAAALPQLQRRVLCESGQVHRQNSWGFIAQII